MKESDQLHNVRTVALPRSILDGTNEALRRFGDTANEGLVLWLGKIVGDTAFVRDYIVPPQDAIQGEGGVGYFVNGQTLLELNRHMSTLQLRMIAQIHSHPGRAYHSSMDDRYAIVTAEGGLSIVVPNFARGPADLSKWTVYRLRNSRWVALRWGEVEKIFSIKESAVGRPSNVLDVKA
jgi:hypothetical protein